MGAEYPADADPSSSCTLSLFVNVRRRLALEPGALLVDLGCGRGGPGLWLAREIGAQLVGVDFSPAAIALAINAAERFTLRAPVRFQVGSFSATGLADHCADGIVSFDALPFAPDRGAALREVNRLLRPGARAVFTASKPADGQPTPAGSLTWSDHIAAAGLALEHDDPRPDVPEFWARLHAQWAEHESELRTALGDRAVDDLLTEAREFGPKLATLHFCTLTVRSGTP